MFAFKRCGIVFHTINYILLLLLTCSITILGCNSPKYTPDEKAEINHFAKSMELRRAASKMMNEATQSEGMIGVISEKTINNYINKLTEALEESQQVSDSVLLKIHPDLPTKYRLYFIPCLKHQISGYRSHDASAQMNGQILEDKWVDWYNQYYKEFN